MGRMMIIFITLFLSGVFNAPHSITCGAVEYYVTPQLHNSECSFLELPCHTIEQYAQSATHFFDKPYDVTLFFLNGVHTLSSYGLEIADKQQLTLAVYDDLDQKPNVTIKILNGKNISLSNVFRLNIANILFSSNYDNTKIPIGKTKTISIVNVHNFYQHEVLVHKCFMELENVGTTEFYGSRFYGSLLVFTVDQQPGNENTISIENNFFNFTTVNVQNIETSQLIDSIEKDSHYGYFQSNTQRRQVHLNINSCEMVNSLIAVLTRGNEEPVSAFTVTIMDTVIDSDSYPLEWNSGVYIELQQNDSEVRMHMVRCNVTRNHYGIQIYAQNNTHVQVDVRESYILYNRLTQIGPQTDGGYGIGIFSGSHFTAVINVTLSHISGNNNGQISISSALKSRITLNIDKTTLRDENFISTSGIQLDLLKNSEAHAHINVKDSYIMNNYVGIYVYADNLLLGIFDSVIEASDEEGLLLVILEDSNIRIKRSKILKNGKTGILLGELNGILNITLIKTEIAENDNGFLIKDINTPPSKINIHVHMKDCIVRENTGVSLHVDYPLYLQFNMVDVDVFMKNVTFLHNFNPPRQSGIIRIDGPMNVSIEDCTFRDNIGSSIVAYLTDFTLSGTILFQNNTADQGGAIVLIFSKMFLGNNTMIEFQNNTAHDVGGGIYVEQFTPSLIDISNYPCFYQLSVFGDLSVINVTLFFVNNTAQNGGDNIYGASIHDDCTIILGFPSYVLIDELFKFNNKSSSSLSPISSDPKRVCLCDLESHPKCAELSYIFHHVVHYPGEKFVLPAVVVGDEFGTVSGVVYASLLPQNHTLSSLEPGEHVQQVDSTACNDLEFTVYSNRSEEVLVLTSNKNRVLEYGDPGVANASIHNYDFQDYHVIPYTLLTYPVFVNVTLLKCPPGFQLVGKLPRCGCSEKLEENGINNCFIANKTSFVYREGNVWISKVFDPNGILVHKYSPLGYCKTNKMSLNLNYPDEQCALNHSGLICGACQPNLSLAIGSSRCLSCPNNNHVALLLAFAAAGFVLVLFIKILNMTVAQGTINGLIFYANIIWANQSILFPNPTEKSGFLQFLKTFLAWLNLDLGIETCFILGLNAYWKTWLQFVFPIYVWAIAGLIILLSHYSNRFTKLLGNNSVPVLATLFLLSYAKLLRTIIIALGFTVLRYPDGPRLIWSFDGNVPYFGLKHAFLFVAAVITLVLLWLPYTFTLLCIQWLRKYSEYRLLRWVNMFKPFFDAYVGPFKDKHVYWIGLLLLTRVVLLLIFATTSAIAPSINLVMIISIVSVLSLQACNVYKTLKMSILESSFLINLILFSSGTLFIEINGGSKEGLACTSVGLAFLQFVAIVAYHTYKRFSSCKDNSERHGYVKLDEEELKQLKQMARQNVQESARLREPLLESSTSVNTY